jgi:3-hydroxyisobutyrate dehydrogenase-like beta-hydroxyacid dehydrogenase
MPDAMPTVGFIGLGDQGAPIAQAISDGGYPLPVRARRPGSLTALKGTTFTPIRAAGDIVSLGEAAHAVIERVVAGARQLDELTAIVGV